MKMNNLGYLLKEGVRSIFSHGLMSFASVCVTVACLLIVGTFSILMYNLNIMVEDMNQTNEVICYVSSDYTDAEAKSVHSKINMIENVYQATYVSREDALTNFVSGYGTDDGTYFAGVAAEDLRHRVVVVLEDNARMKETVALLEQVEGVEEIAAEYELAEGFTTISNVVSLISTGIIAILLAVSLLIISNTVKLAMYDRKNEIAIMKMVGATNGFIRFPFIVQGFFLGILGAGLAFGAEWVLYDALVTNIQGMDSMGLFNFVPFRELLMPMVITFSAAGLFVGVFGSISAIRKFMDV